MDNQSRPLEAGEQRLSRVRFSRGNNMEPLPTTASDSTVHGVHHDPRFARSSREPVTQAKPPDDQHQMYDVNGYPYGGEEISLSDTRDMAMSDDEGYYQESIRHEDDDQSYQHDHQQNNVAEYQQNPSDSYTQPPARVGGRRFSPHIEQRPAYGTYRGPDPEEEMENPYAGPVDISPRGSIVLDSIGTQPALHFHHQQQQAREQMMRDQARQQQDDEGAREMEQRSREMEQRAREMEERTREMEEREREMSRRERERRDQDRRDPQLQRELIQKQARQYGQISSSNTTPNQKGTPARQSMLMSNNPINGSPTRPRPPPIDPGFDTYEYDQSAQGSKGTVPSIVTPDSRGGQPRQPKGNYDTGPNPYPAQVSPGFRQYDEVDSHGRRLSPAPAYASPRNSDSRGPDRIYAQPAIRPGQNVQQPRTTDNRFDSDTTLQGDIEYGTPKRLSIPGERNFDDYSVDQRRVSDLSVSGSSLAPASKEGEMHRRSTRQVEDGDDSYSVKGGFFSHFLRFGGKSSGMRRRTTGHSATNGEGPNMSRNASRASTVFGGEELDLDDPRVTGVKKKRNFKRRNSFGDAPAVLRRGSQILGLSGGRPRRQSIQIHVTDLLTRHQFILKLAKALMTFGAPSHRIESQLAATAIVLEVDAQFIHFPSIVIASFGDIDTRTSETHFVKASGGLDLGKLHRVHNIYRSVVHDEMDAAEGTQKVQALLKAPMQYNLWQRMILAFLCSGIIAPMGFGGSFIDGLASGCCAIMLSFLQIHVTAKSAMYSNIFEISIATIISFAARGLSATGLFCYQAVGSAGVVLILPGYTILCGSLELASKNIVSGSVRMVYAIIYSLFLGFGITIGSDLFFVMDQAAKRASIAAAQAAEDMTTLIGTFTPEGANSTFAPFSGSFSFRNASNTGDAVTSALQRGSVICHRPEGLPWYRQSMPPYFLLLTVPVFSLILSMWNMQPIRSKQMPVMVVISCIGYATNNLANRYIFNHSDVVSAIGAFVVGILGNIYSRLFGGTAFTSMVTGVLFLVPSGIAAAGGLAMSAATDSADNYNQGLIIGFRMVQVAIGITVGLFGSGLLIYSFGSKKGAALFAF